MNISVIIIIIIIIIILYIIAQYTACKLCREDAMGNIFGRWQGSEPALGSVLTGSHCDAIPLAGMYDGTLGVIGAIEALAALKRAVSNEFECCSSVVELLQEPQQPTQQQQQGQQQGQHMKHV
jgi:hypothetical protein